MNTQILYEEYKILWFEFDLCGLRHRDFPDDYNCFEIRYCGRPAFPHTYIQLEQSTKLILSHFRE